MMGKLALQKCFTRQWNPAIQPPSYHDHKISFNPDIKIPGFYGPTVVAFTGFHCTKKDHPKNEIKGKKKRRRPVFSHLD